MPFGRNLPRQRPQAPIEARTLNRPAQTTEGLTRIQFGPDVETTWINGIPLVRARLRGTKGVAKVVGGPIAARTIDGTSIVAGRGSGILMQENADGWTTDRGEPIELWNTTNGDEIPEDSFVQVGRTPSGRWLIDVADC